jgi:antitoxin component of RelBE/YafQ-DinJ toxin-antitoxin module
MGKKKKVTLSLDDEVYKQFQEFCEENDLMLSKRVERLMKKHIEENISKKNKGGKK